MASPGQFELQLGQLCNNRCGFCISGQATHLGAAPLLADETLRDELRRAYAAGHRRVTLLGGEPTIQPAFLPVVREAVALGFEAIVIFSNGSRLARGSMIDDVLATGGRFEWRLSFQGATREAHERTTGRRGSFDRLVQAVTRLRERGQRVTVNMCVVTSNFASLPGFAALMALGVSQLHLDMLNPHDTGMRTDDEVRALQPRYRELVAPLTALIEALPRDFDVNIGNLPYCVAPQLTPWIHHGGPATENTSADLLSDRPLRPSHDKFLIKGDRKQHLPVCRSCALRDRCPGVFDVYRRWFGDDEFSPVSAAQLASLEPPADRPAALPASVTRRLARLQKAAPFGSLRWESTRGAGEAGVEIALRSPGDERAFVWLDERSGRPVGGYRLAPSSSAPSDELRQGLAAVMTALGLRVGS